MTDRESAMAQTTDQPTPSFPPESWQWAFSFLREDVQDIRTDLREVRARIDETNQQLGARIDRTNQQLGARIDETNQQLGDRIDELGRRMTVMFTWTLTTMLALSGLMAGLMTALIKF